MSANAVLSWSYYHALAMLAASALAWWFASTGLLVLVVLISFTLFAGVHKRGELLGYANGLTLFRLLLLLYVALSYRELSEWLIAALLIASLILDGFDGYLARRFDEASEFGQYLDVETDAFAILLLSYLLWQQQGLPAWVILAGALRYAYLWIIRLTVSEQRNEPKRRYASVVAVIVYCVMTARLTLGGYLFGVPVFDWLLWMALFALGASFLRSACYQWGVG